MELTTKERAVLKGIAAKEQTIMQVGKDGVSRKLTEALDDALTARELIKIKVLNNCDMTAREVCDVLVADLKCEPVLVIGSKVILYRFNEKKKTHVLTK